MRIFVLITIHFFVAFCTKNTDEHELYTFIR